MDWFNIWPKLSILKKAAISAAFFFLGSIGIYF